MDDDHAGAIADEFAALAGIEPLPPFPGYPSLDRLPYIAYDIIHRLCGIDMHDEDVPLPRKLAANEWFWRRAAGQAVTFDQVYRGGSMADMAVPNQGNGTRPAGTTTPPGQTVTGSL